MAQMTERYMSRGPTIARTRTPCQTALALPMHGAAEAATDISSVEACHCPVYHRECTIPGRPFLTGPTSEIFTRIPLYHPLRKTRCPSRTGFKPQGPCTASYREWRREHGHHPACHRARCLLHHPNLRVANCAIAPTRAYDPAVGQVEASAASVLERTTHRV
ncbi:hypothetical protein OE88DRAFT_264481 [Heliocybe sulcata]|uniref:Uncharacterized protein n=1 Tax=Heliocybe sulcata TaxID=5364 RepID=A0A5C3MZP7_9AGAM|nr:hypothetical protein OE88DRAFT_264481 [Heliocybe sulcata]